MNENVTTTTTSGGKRKTMLALAYYEMLRHVLLLMFTFGVWQFIWIYHMTEATNGPKGHEYRDPVVQLLLCLFVPFYSVYWTYQTSQRVDDEAYQDGIYSELTDVSVILSILVPFVMPILIQDKVNQVVLKQ